MAVAALAAIFLVACTSTTAGRRGPEARPSVSLAFVGAVTGEYAGLGLNLLNGARLAVDEAAGRGDLPVRISLKVFDTQG
ncbi:MAG: hypothetical protein M3379_13290, partial [Acidobacteriota bacterium]|nr:hypothetical protein [Acidobacteriota bacterium]